MSFANNLQYLRKKNKLTQEELAYELAVSRQSVSKWETGEAYPETEKLIIICDKFNVSMDDFVRGDLETKEIEQGEQIAETDYTAQDNEPTETTEMTKMPERPEKIIDHDKAIRHINNFAKYISLGVALILIGASFVVGFGGATEIPSLINMDIFGIIGVSIMLTFIAVAVLLFVFYGMKEEAFIRENKDAKLILSPEEKQVFNKQFALTISLCVSGIILSVVLLLIILGCLDYIVGEANVMYEFYSCLAIAIFLCILSVPVFGLCFAGIKHGHLLAENGYIFDHDHNNHSKEKNIGYIIGAIIMPACAGIYLLMGFVWDLWHPGWVIFPIGGILCGIISTIANALKNDKK